MRTLLFHETNISIITLLRYTQSQNIRELNNLKVFESKKIKGHKSIAFMNSMNIR
jgi:hypothetical protein